MRITTIRHPEYAVDFDDFMKWRLTYLGGRHFMEHYLHKYSKREDDAAFQERKCMSYVPAYAKTAVNKLKNTMFSRLSEITRKDGPESYMAAIRGEGGGVDRHGCSMNSFIGSAVLPELMTMKTVGIFVDRAPANGPLLANNIGNNPYLYIYKTEDILTWDFEFSDGQYRYKNILLRDTYLEYDNESGMVKGTAEKYRQVFMGPDGKVHIQYWLPKEKDNKQDNSNPEDDEDTKLGDEIILDLDQIPFVRLALNSSLLADVADYQVALMNIASSDINYVFQANFPTYTEQEDPFAASIYTRGPGPASQSNGANGSDSAGTGSASRTSSSSQERRSGALQGRVYAKGMDRPDYVHPSSEPLLASIQKQEQMKREIFELVDIAASQAEPQHASADSKQMDDRGLESGLSMIGLELEWAENEIAKIWAKYENKTEAFVKYPAKYTLKTDQQRVEQCESLDLVKGAAPSRTYSKEITKVMAHVMLDDKVTPETLEKIEKEIDAAEFTTSDPNTIKIAIDAGVVDAVTASDAMGFDGDKVVPIAQKEHAERLKRINDAQAEGNAAARGVPDKSGGNKADANLEKLGKIISGHIDGGTG